MALSLPPSSIRQQAAWSALFEIYDQLPDGWVLAGGQAVYLHAIERRAGSVRPTEDADTILDVRAYPGMLLTFTTVLDELGFSSAGESLSGHQHRWIRGQAVVDVLIPRGTGRRNESRCGFSGGTTIPTPGGQIAVDRSEKLEVVCGGKSGMVNRATFLGCLIGKAAAMRIIHDPNSKRHVDDFLNLASVLRPRDLRGVAIGTAERGHLTNMLGLLANNPNWLLQSPESQLGLSRLRIFLS